MVTEAGKELLRNTINTAKFHNKLLEENEMWKQWELERGLTMMVSDDDVLKRIRKNHRCEKHRRRENSRERKTNDSFDAVPGTSKDTSDRWDHSGFRELYPDAVDSEKSSSSNSKDRSKKHKKKKKKRHHSETSSSDNEIYEEFKKYKKSQSTKNKVEIRKSSTSGLDNHVKEWRKQIQKYL